jgi:hypothetical protein
MCVDSTPGMTGVCVRMQGGDCELMMETSGHGAMRSNRWVAGHVAHLCTCQTAYQPSCLRMYHPCMPVLFHLCLDLDPHFSQHTQAGIYHALPNRCMYQRLGDCTA